MNWIKITISALAMSAAPLLFGQLTQSGNSFEKLNSATAGLFYKHEGNLTARAIGGSGFYNLATFANYSTVSKNGKYGFGINHFGVNRSFLSNTLSVNVAKLNVNRQFVFKNAEL